MIHTSCVVRSLRKVGPDIFVLNLFSPEISPRIGAGQFVNIRITDSCRPLLRRPFSVYRVEHDCFEIIFNIVGLGTKILSTQQEGDILDVIGPLGNGFTTDDTFDSGMLVAGGLGVAPLPLITSELRKQRKSITTFVGAKSGNLLITDYLMNVKCAADDGTAEFHGTVVELLVQQLKADNYNHSKIFACGPNPMLRRLSQVAAEFNIPCEMSLESAMACGIGICQGCPVENCGGDKKYSLICTDGPVFDSQKIQI